MRAYALALAAFTLVAVACAAGPDLEGKSRRTPAPSTPATTTTITTTTTVAEPVVEVSMEGDPQLLAAVAALYSWVTDRSVPMPDIPSGLADHLPEVTLTESIHVEAVAHTAVVEEGSVAVVTADDDVVLAADEGEGWKVVGAWLARFDVDPWYGNPIRHVLIVGTDARAGQSQPDLRADSIHIVSSNLPEGGGAILGFPRDTYVQASYGRDKFTHVNRRSDTEEMVEIAERLSGLPLDGYLLTGFAGFWGLVKGIGGVVIDIPLRMLDPKAKADLFPGEQRLDGNQALAFSRSRRVPGGDFGRSLNQGVVILGALANVLDRDITQLPTLMVILTENAWTNIGLGDLLTLGATAFVLDPEAVGNAVLPGRTQRVGGASVVILDEEGAEATFRDLDDGMLGET